MSFMQPYVELASYYEVSANRGETWIVPADVVGTPQSLDDFRDYVDGTIDDDEDMPELKTGWIARMSAPGYMDCTDWTAHDSEADAWEELASNCGDGFTTYRLPACWASYFINGDASGLSDAEQSEADAWIAENPDLDHLSPNCIGEPFFVHRADSGHVGCDVCVFVFQVKGE